MDKTLVFEGEKEEFNLELLEDFIKQHEEIKKRYLEMENLYQGHHAILTAGKKADYKPDNRLVVNYAKYIVDTFNGFFMGKPVKVVAEGKLQEYLADLVRLNNLDDNNYDLSKKCSIYGHAFELLYLDEKAQVGITQVDPKECFIIYDQSIRRKPIFGVRYRRVDQGIEGTISDDERIIYFKGDSQGKLKITDELPHYFGHVPMVEYVENEEKLGAFEPVITLINAYNKAISEKANDVDYFADAYMKILGAILDEETLHQIRDNRIINLASEDTDKLIEEFMEKPNADRTQENLLEKLEKQIFAISMVANINDENFGTSSGIALKYKLLSMMNLANTKERKFVKGFNERFKLISNLPNSPITEEDLKNISYTFTRNIPENNKEEAEIARSLQGIVSDETLLDSLSLVKNVKMEMERIKDEEEFSPEVDYQFEEDHDQEVH